MKKLITITLVLMAMALIVSPASATPITISVTSPLSVVGNGSGQVTFTFGIGYDQFNNVVNQTNLQTINNSIPINGALAGKPWSTSPTGFTFDANANTFTPSNAVISFGDASTGVLSGTINYIALAGSGGSFTLNVSLTGLTYTCGGGCTSNTVLSSFGALGGGLLSTQFTIGNLQNTADLATFNNTSDRQSGNSTISGTVSAVPEPASLALLGTGLLTGGSFVRRKLGIGKS